DRFAYTSPKVKERVKDHFLGLVKELRNQFLARTTPELNTLVKYLNDALVSFFIDEIPPQLGEIAWEVVKEARLADARVSAGYKISASAFKRFRQAFERKFMQRLVPFVADQMLARVRGGEEEFRKE